MQSYTSIFGQNPGNGIFTGTVKDFFTQYPGYRALTSYNLSAAQLTVGFQPSSGLTSSVGLLFHEGLHGYGLYINGGKSVGNFSDAGLMTLFGLTGKDTGKIEDYINSYCGSYFHNVP